MTHLLSGTNINRKKAHGNCANCIWFSKSDCISVMRWYNQLYTCMYSCSRENTHTHTHTHTHTFPGTDSGWVMSASPYCYCDGSRFKGQQSAFISQTYTLSLSLPRLCLSTLSHSCPRTTSTHTHTHTHTQVGKVLGVVWNWQLSAVPDTHSVCCWLATSQELT